jgi:hypothetical protein
MPLLARRAASATERTLVYFRMNMYIRPPTPLCSSPTHQNISGRRWTRAYFREWDGPAVLPPNPRAYLWGAIIERGDTRRGLRVGFEEWENGLAVAFVIW